MADVSFFKKEATPGKSEISRLRKMAEKLMEQGKSDGKTQIVSGYAVKQSPLEGLAKGIQTGLGAYYDAKASRAEDLKAENARKTMADAIATYGKSQDTTPTQLANGEIINWEPTSLDASGRMYSNILMQNEDTAPMGMQSQMDQMQNKQKMAMELEQFRQMMPLQIDLARQKAAIEAAYTKPSEFDRFKSMSPQEQAQYMAFKGKTGGGISVDPDTGEITTNFSNKPLPVGALKMQQEAVDALTASQNTSELAKKLAAQADDGSLDLGPVSNMINRGRNMIGASTPESVNLGLMETDLEKLRNDTLRLNKGVQTEGDAVRAMNEVLQSKNDPKLFSAAMARLNAINDRAATLQQMQIDQIRQNYNAAPLGVQSVPNDYNSIQPLLNMEQAVSPGRTSPPPSPAQGGMGNLSFNSPEEAEAANLPVGTVIFIGGRKAVVE